MADRVSALGCAPEWMISVDGMSMMVNVVDEML